MTGENFKRLNRTNEKLLRMIHEMDKAVDEYRKVMDAMRNDEPCTWEEFHAAEDKCERLNWYLENMGYNYWKGQSI